MSVGPQQIAAPDGGSGTGAAVGGGLAAAGLAGGPVGLAVVAGLQLWSGIQQAEMIRTQARLQQQVQDMNAQFAEADAYEAEKFGYTQVARYKSVIDSTLADQRVGLAAQDVDINYGTAGQLQSQTKLTGILNTIDIQRQAREKAMGFKREARMIRLGSQMGRSQANLDASATVTSAALSAARTASSGYTRK